MMGARLKRDIGGRATSALARLFKRLRLGMRATTNRGDAPPNDNGSDIGLPNDQRGDGGVGTGAPLMVTSQPDGGSHETPVGFVRHGISRPISLYRRRYVH